MEQSPGSNTDKPIDFEASASKDKEKAKDKKKTSKSQAAAPKLDKKEGLLSERSEEVKPPPLERLADDEKVVAAKDYIARRGQDVSEEIAGAPAQSNAEAAGLANAALLDNLSDKLDAGQPVAPELIDEALAETAEALGLDLTVSETEQGDEEPAVEVESTQPNTNETEPEETEAEDNGNVPAGGANNGAAGGGNHGNVNNGGGNGGPGGRGLRGPIGPPPPGGNFGPNNPNPPGGPNNLHNGNFLPNTPVNLHERRHGHAKYVLAGGIVGYFIGRRRGRIKTEKELLPVQHKLEKEVTSLQQQIAERETKIRRMAREQAANQPELAVRMAERLRTRPTREAIAPQEVENPAEVRPESIGKIALKPPASETSAATKTAELATPAELATAAVIAERQAKEPVLRVETAPLEQVLRLAEDIKVENRDLRELYERGRIEQKDVRKIIKAYVKGERYDRLLSESIKPLRSQEFLPRSTAALDAPSDHPSASARSPQLEQLINDAHTPRSLDYQRSDGVLNRPEIDEPLVSNRALAWSLAGLVILLIAWLIFK